MSEEDEIKKRMLKRQQEAMQQQAMQQTMHQQTMNEQLELLKAVMNEVLEPKARERLNNLKLVKPELATQVQMYLAQAYQAGQIRGKLSENDLISILKMVTEKKEFRIKRR